MSRRRRHTRECPTPSKTPYESVEDARQAYDWISSFHRVDHDDLLYAYPCQCGRWHHSKKFGAGSVPMFGARS